MTRFATLGRQLPLSPAQAIDEWAARNGVSLTNEQRMSLRLFLTDREIDAEHRVRSEIMRSEILKPHGGIHAKGT
jgi:hypothetical protein